MTIIVEIIDLLKRMISINSIEKINYQLEISEKKLSFRKKSTTKPLVKISIDDEILYQLYKKNLLLDEVMIQDRLKLKGTKKNTDKLFKLFINFFDKN